MAKVHDGKQWIPVSNDDITSGSTVPVPPVKGGDGTIFVSIPSFRDGKRCAQTIKSLFENAKDPSKVYVGLIEQTAPGDDYCIESYCRLYGVPPFLEKHSIRADTTKVTMQAKGQDKNCPYYNNIRMVAEYNIAAKGPSDARALGRKVLGNEEYCMQIDAHMSFVKNWDALAQQEWNSIQNEFAILSTVPAQKLSDPVPRQCLVRYSGTDIPDYESPADGHVEGLTKPLLSHAWSAAFAFSKCHLEESAPYDSFAPYILGAEQFPRFARFWTRGYDVYTPTQHIVLHNYAAAEHGKQEWIKKRRERLRQESLQRIRSFLGIGEETSDKIQANLGIYGLGKRRSLKQLNEFVGINLPKQLGNRLNTKCADHTWVPYDTTISPVENLHTNADDLDPQPIYPLRTHLVYYQQEHRQPQQMKLEGVVPKQAEGDVEVNVDGGMASTGAPMDALFVFWVLGLVMWCVVFMNKGNRKLMQKNRKGLTGKDV